MSNKDNKNRMQQISNFSDQKFPLSKKKKIKQDLSCYATQQQLIDHKKEKRKHQIREIREMRVRKYKPTEKMLSFIRKQKESDINENNEDKKQSKKVLITESKNRTSNDDLASLIDLEDIEDAQNAFQEVQSYMKEKHGSTIGEAKKQRRASEFWYQNEEEMMVSKKQIDEKQKIFTSTLKESRVKNDKRIKYDQQLEIIKKQYCNDKFQQINQKLNRIEKEKNDYLKQSYQLEAECKQQIKSYLYPHKSASQSANQSPSSSRQQYQVLRMEDFNDFQLSRSNKDEIYFQGEEFDNEQDVDNEDSFVRKTIISMETGKPIKPYLQLASLSEIIQEKRKMNIQNKKKERVKSLDLQLLKKLQEFKNFNFSNENSLSSIEQEHASCISITQKRNENNKNKDQLSELTGSILTPKQLQKSVYFPKQSINKGGISLNLTAASIDTNQDYNIICPPSSNRQKEISLTSRKQSLEGPWCSYSIKQNIKPLSKSVRSSIDQISSTKNGKNLSFSQQLQLKIANELNLKDKLNQTFQSQYQIEEQERRKRQKQINNWNNSSFQLFLQQKKKKMFIKGVQGIKRSLKQEKSALQSIELFDQSRIKMDEEFKYILETYQRDRPITSQIRERVILDGDNTISNDGTLSRPNTSSTYRSYIQENTLKKMRKIAEGERKRILLENNSHQIIEWYDNTINKLVQLSSNGESMSLSQYIMDKIKQRIEDGLVFDKDSFFTLLKRIEQQEQSQYNNNSLFVVTQALNLFAISIKSLSSLKKLHTAFKSLKNLKISQGSNSPILCSNHNSSKECNLTLLKLQED